MAKLTDRFRETASTAGMTAHRARSCLAPMKVIAAHPDHSSALLATDAPLSDRNLTRLARRTFAGMARTGSPFSNGSGDYAVAFSTSREVLRTPERRSQKATVADLPNDLLSPLFRAVSDAAEETIYNSMLQATPVVRRDEINGKQVIVKAFETERLRSLLHER